MVTELTVSSAPRVFAPLAWLYSLVSAFGIERLSSFAPCHFSRVALPWGVPSAPFSLRSLPASSAVERRQIPVRRNQPPRHGTVYTAKFSIPSRTTPHSSHTSDNA
jgi:hypothetical protein